MHDARAQFPSNSLADLYDPLKDANAASFNLTTWRNGSRFMITVRPVPEVLDEFNAFTLSLSA